MSTIGSIEIRWDVNGDISWALSFPDKKPEQVYALGGVALTDHMLATLNSEHVISFLAAVLPGLQENRIPILPINTELTGAALELCRGAVLYTKFNPKSKFFCDNQKLDDAIRQMGVNYIAKVLAAAEKDMLDGAKFGILGVVASYEQQVRAVHESGLPAATGRANVAKAIAVFINRFPYGVKPEDLQHHLEGAGALLEKWKMLPLRPGKALFQA